MRELKHALFFGFLAMLSLSYGFKFFAIVSVTMALLKLSQWYQHPHRKLWSIIKRDAKKFQVKLPATLSVKQNLLKLYSRTELLKLYHPYTSESLKELIAAMWRNLKYNPNLVAWGKEINQTVLSLPQFNQVEVQSQRYKFNHQIRRDQQLWEHAAQKANR